MYHILHAILCGDELMIFCVIFVQFNVCIITLLPLGRSITSSIIIIIENYYLSLCGCYKNINSCWYHGIRYEIGTVTSNLPPCFLSKGNSCRCSHYFLIHQNGRTVSWNSLSVSVPISCICVHIYIIFIHIIIISW